jgi:D-beta-D-heptose 7-phosphate kinase/D-beta-D-heptose 1-phosphate adenosyltransferase
VVLTNGCFDVLHSGHVMLIEEARRLGDFLIVAINTDESVRRFKGANRPVNGERERAAVLGALQAVDAVTVFGEDTPVELIRAVRPDVLVKGAEYSIEEIPGASFVESYGGRVARVPMKPGFSTTESLRRSGHPCAETVTSRETRGRFVGDRSVQRSP